MSKKQSPAYELLPERLLPWFATHARDLPWRKDNEPYHVWLSEIMLQQTRVEAVKLYYLRFLKALPTIRALAHCDEDTLMKLWEGLGYYTRAKNLLRAARHIMIQNHGVFPSDYESLRKLPGVGAYTAGAIASICFDLPEPAVDGNVLRVLSRIYLDDGCIDDQAVKRRVQEGLRKVYETLPQGKCGSMTQALMELGAVVCIPNGTPHCAECPCADLCKAKAQNAISLLPVRKEKKSRRIEYHTVFTLQCGNRIAIQKRPDKGLLAGLWELPHANGKLDPQSSIHQAEEWGCQPSAFIWQAQRTHIFTHVEWHMTCVHLLCDNMPDCYRWVTLQELETEAALPTAFRIALPNLDSNMLPSYLDHQREALMEWYIRAATASDVEELAQLRLRQLAEIGDAPITSINDALYTYFHEMITTGAQSILVAADQDHILATGGLSYVQQAPYYENPTGKIALIFSLYTIPDYRRMGLAAAIMKKLMQIAKRMGCGEIYASASEESTPFFEEFGFTSHANFRHRMLE